jgi:hypothetical protein
MGHIAWGVISVLLILVSHRSSVFFRVICLINFVTQIDCRFTCWILGFLPQFSYPPFMFQQMIQAREIVVYIRKSNFTCRQPICRSYRDCKVARRFIGFYPRINFDLRWY